MDKIDWKRKLSSRKLWIAVAGFVSGFIIAFGGEKQIAETVSGCILQGASVLGYIIAEGLTDAANKEPSVYITPEVFEDTEFPFPLISLSSAKKLSFPAANSCNKK